MFQSAMAAVMRASPLARYCRAATARSRKRPRRWKQTARASALRASPLFQLNRGLAPEFRHLQPVQSEQCSLEAADFAQGQRQPVLPWVSTKPLEEERSAGRPGAHRYRQAQDILPVSHDQLFVDAAGDERREYWPRAGRPEGVEPAIGTLTA